jgi:hypothetical protein
VIKQGELQHTMRFTLDGGALDADTELVVGQLRVAPASGTDEVRRQLGLPLSLIVALAKDDKGEIRANIPVAGSLSDPTFSLRGLVWTAVRQAVARIVRAPFRGISHLRRAGDTVEAPTTIEAPTVDPVTFAAGSAVIAPDMAQHLLRVADFLRRSPFVNLTLAPAPGAGDVEALRAQAVTARLRAFQAERGLPDGPGVVAAYIAERFPEVPPPATVDDGLALLREREPEPVGPLRDLAQRRIDATRERLVSVEGIPAGRLEIAAPRPDGVPGTASAPGRVEFTVVAGRE